MKMKLAAIASLAIASFALGGCSTIDKMQADARAKLINYASSECAAIGYQVGSQAHRQCTSQLYSQKLATKAANARAAGNRASANLSAIMAATSYRRY